MLVEQVETGGAGVLVEQVETGVAEVVGGISRDWRGGGSWWNK